MCRHVFHCVNITNDDFTSGAEGTRTPDPLHAMQVRYQLRHSPVILADSVPLPSKQLEYSMQRSARIPNQRTGSERATDRRAGRYHAAGATFPLGYSVPVDAGFSSSCRSMDGQSFHSRSRA
jgi:hypothetical protein